MENEAIKNLREALQFSPENIHLRLLLAETLIQHGFTEESEKEYKEILNKEPNHVKARTGLAKIYVRSEKFTVAAVILEEVVKEKDCPAEGFLLYTKVLVKENALIKAGEYYKKALSLDPSLTDEELDNLLTLKNIPEIETSSNSSNAYSEKYTGGFETVGGMQKVKDEIRLKIILPLQKPDLYKAFGKKTGGGILLYGPPGCGKTLMAKATAGEVKANFISVGINDILDMYIGSSEKQLHAIFEQARNSQPCVVFFDEVDALGASRTDMRHSAGRHLINQFLSELDGMNANNDGLLVLGATNAPWHLDSAFRRPGRFDRIIFVPPPDEEARVEILNILLKGKPVKDLDIRSIAKRTKDFSGADLQSVIDVAVEGKLVESLEKGEAIPLTSSDLTKAADKVSPSTKDWFTTAKNYALYSNESGLYDDILQYLGIKK